MEYKLSDTKAENIKDTVIEKTGVIVKFTMGELEGADAGMEKILKEITAKRDYEKAKMTNIETNHPFVLTLSEEDLFTAHMYQDSKNLVKMAEIKIPEFKKQLAEDAAEILEIKCQIPELAVVPSTAPADQAAAETPVAATPEAPAPAAEGAVPSPAEFLPGAGDPPAAA